MPKKKEISSDWDKKNILLYIALPLLIGIILAAFIPRPQIGVIHLNYTIDDVITERTVKQIQYAMHHPEVRAVVLIMDCPGGTINGTELIYLELIKLRQTKPVVSMVEGMSASGSYYLAVGTDYIISNPSAMVGNVGVIGEIPSKPRIYEETYSTGPYKFWGFAQDSYIRQIDMMKTSFLEAVLIGRGKRLNTTAEYILRGEIFTANEALRLGLIDELGPQSLAYEKAASLAHISHYKIVDLQVKVSMEASEDNSTSFYALDEDGNPTNRPAQAGFYYLYIPMMEGWQP